MDAAVEAFKDEMGKKAAAKQKALVAVGSGDWDTVAEYGINGEEGKAFAEMQAMADAYVEANASKFAAFEQYVTPEGNEQLVKLIATLGKSDMEEAALELTMFELAKFERQTFGVAPKANVRLGHGG
jgi:hypothetical protein